MVDAPALRARVGRAAYRACATLGLQEGAEALRGQAVTMLDVVDADALAVRGVVRVALSLPGGSGSLAGSVRAPLRAAALLAVRAVSNGLPAIVPVVVHVAERLLAEAGAARHHAGTDLLTEARRSGAPLELRP